MYSFSGYGEMVRDGVRMGAYTAALRRAVRPGSVVLDIGTGTGFFALLACRYGARKVYAIEPDDAIQLARQTAVANGLADRIEFIQGLSTQITLPEQADVIVSDLRGVLPPFQHHIPSIADARRRLLAPGGVLIPRRDTLWVCVVEAPGTYREYLDPWTLDPYGVDMRAGRELVTNTWKKARFGPGQLLAEPQRWAELDYATLENPDLAATVTLTVARPGTGHGLCLWFDAELADGIGFSNAPGAPKAIYGSAFFPWSEPVVLAAGDTVALNLRADLAGDDYTWGWESGVSRGTTGEPVAHFRQSTLLGVPLSPEQLRKRSDGHVPGLNLEGCIDRLILESMQAGMPLGQIASLVAERFPDRFPRWEEALTRVGDLSLKYSQ
jgi:type I protein arginine methyltransferase